MNYDDDMLGNIVRQRFRLPELSRGVARWIAIGIVAIILLSTTLYSVATDEVGVVKRLGVYTRTTPSGLHAKLPFALEKVHKVRVKHVFKEEFGFATERAGIRTAYRKGDFSSQSHMLTGDLNAAVVEWIVQFKVKDPVQYLFKVRDVSETIRDVSETAMRQVVGDRSVTEVLTVGRRDAADNAHQLTQEILDGYETGIEIVTVNLKDVNPPDPVKRSFNEVNQAKQEKEKLINEAWSEYNKAIPAARGEAERMIRDAEGYALARVNRAQGDAKRFVAVWKEYARAKDVTKRRLYLEMMSEILPDIHGKYIIDPKLSNLIPLLQLDKKGGQK